MTGKRCEVGTGAGQDRSQPSPQEVRAANAGRGGGGGAVAGIGPPDWIEPSQPNPTKLSLNSTNSTQHTLNSTFPPCSVSQLPPSIAAHDDWTCQRSLPATPTPARNDAFRLASRVKLSRWFIRWITAQHSTPSLTTPASISVNFDRRAHPDWLSSIRHYRLLKAIERG